MTIVVLLVVVAVVGAVVVVLAGKNGQQAEFEPDRPNFAFPSEPLVPTDIDGVRFSVGLRGYRMDQVDAVMDRLALELAERDRRIAELSGQTPAADVEGEPFVEAAESAEASSAANAASAEQALSEPGDVATITAPDAVERD